MMVAHLLGHTWGVVTLEMFRMKQDTSLLDGLVSIWVWQSFTPRTTPVDQFGVLITKVKASHSSRQWRINYKINVARKR